MNTKGCKMTHILRTQLRDLRQMILMLNPVCLFNMEVPLMLQIHLLLSQHMRKILSLQVPNTCSNPIKTKFSPKEHMHLTLSNLIRVHPTTPKINFNSNQTAS